MNNEWFEGKHSNKVEQFSFVCTIKEYDTIQTVRQRIWLGIHIQVDLIHPSCPLP